MPDTQQKRTYKHSPKYAEKLRRKTEIFETIIVSATSEVDKPFEKAAKALQTTVSGLKRWSYAVYGTTRFHELKQQFCEKKGMPTENVGKAAAIKKIEEALLDMTADPRKRGAIYEQVSAEVGINVTTLRSWVKSTYGMTNLFKIKARLIAEQRNGGLKTA